MASRLIAAERASTAVAVPPAKGRIRQFLEDLPLLEKAIGSAVFLGGLGYAALKAIGL